MRRKRCAQRPAHCPRPHHESHTALVCTSSGQQRRRPAPSQSCNLACRRARRWRPTLRSTRSPRSRHPRPCVGCHEPRNPWAGTGEIGPFGPGHCLQFPSGPQVVIIGISFLGLFVQVERYGSAEKRAASSGAFTVEVNPALTPVYLDPSNCKRVLSSLSGGDLLLVGPFCSE
jgi:hypothetical protein